MTNIDEAKKIAGRSSIGKHMTGAVICAGSSVLTNGWSHVPHYKLRSKRSLHAEIHALARGRHTILDNCSISIATIARRSGNYVSAKPCLDCAIALHAVGVDQVYYTVNNDENGYLWLGDPAVFEDLKVYQNGD
jgi:tRNA(Arg) A34 adenosine deaminase TadA